MTPSALNYRKTRKLHWDTVAKRRKKSCFGNYYHQRLKEIYQFLIPPGQKILEIGCGDGDLLASLKAEPGIGIDLSFEMLRYAAEQHPELCLIQCDSHEISLNEKFDVIILSDLVNDLWDVQTVFGQISGLSASRTRIIINIHSRLWEIPLIFAQKFGQMTPLLSQNWLTAEDISNLLNLADFEIIRHWQEILLPLKVPVISTFLNHFLVKLFPFRWFGLTNFIVARSIHGKKHAALRTQDSALGTRHAALRTQDSALRTQHSGLSTHFVSVIIPARNEEGNISNIFDRVPEMGRGTELIFVEGHSIDNTYSAIKNKIGMHPEKKCRLFQQTGTGKGDAVRLGFSHAGGDILMILDADLTVPPEDLPRFYDVLVSEKGDFVNGVRLVYPMEKQAMRYLNMIGNKFFSLAFSWLLGQPVKDTLCGTKVLWKTDYKRIAENRGYFGDFDPFGDFDLLFGAAKLNLKIVEMPIRYAERTYGETNIQRWRHGWLLLKMVAFAMKRIKFI